MSFCAPWSCKSRLAEFKTCQIPEKLGLPSRVRGRADWPKTGASVRAASAIVDTCMILLRIRSARSGRSNQQIAPVGQLDGGSVDRERTILGPIALDDHLESLREIGLAEAAPQHG